MGLNGFITFYNQLHIVWGVWNVARAHKLPFDWKMMINPQIRGYPIFKPTHRFARYLILAMVVWGHMNRALVESMAIAGESQLFSQACWVNENTCWLVKTSDTWRTGNMFHKKKYVRFLQNVHLVRGFFQLCLMTPEGKWSNNHRRILQHPNCRDSTVSCVPQTCSQKKTLIVRLANWGTRYPIVSKVKLPDTWLILWMVAVYPAPIGMWFIPL